MGWAVVETNILSAPLPSVSFHRLWCQPPPLLKLLNSEKKLNQTTCLNDEWISNERKEEWKSGQCWKRSQCPLKLNLKCLTLEILSVDLWVLSCLWHHMVGWMNVRTFGIWRGGGQRSCSVWAERNHNPLPTFRARKSINTTSWFRLLNH